MSGTDVRFNVQRPEGQRQDGEWEDVGADGGFEVHPSGALVFYGPDREVVIAYAPHAWLTVTPDH